MSQKIDSAFELFESMEEKGEKINNALQHKYEVGMNKLRHQKKQLENDWSELQSAGEERLESSSEKMNSALTSFKQGVEELAEIF